MDYALSRADLKGIAAGAIDLILARPGRAGRTAHPALGDTVGLDDAGQNLPWGEACVVLRARVRIGPQGIVRVLDVRHSPVGEPLARLLAAAEQAAPQAADHAPKLAARCGAADWPTWYAAERGKGEPRIVLREVIGIAGARAFPAKRKGK